MYNTDQSERPLLMYFTRSTWGCTIFIKSSEIYQYCQNYKLRLDKPCVFIETFQFSIKIFFDSWFDWHVKSFVNWMFCYLRKHYFSLNGGTKSNFMFYSKCKISLWWRIYKPISKYATWVDTKREYFRQQDTSLQGLAQYNKSDVHLYMPN